MMGVVQVLLNASADPDTHTITGFTPLMHAAYNGHAKVVQVHLDAGVGPNTYAYYYPYDSKLFAATALYWAEVRGHQDVAQILRNAGATR